MQELRVVNFLELVENSEGTVFQPVKKRTTQRITVEKGKFDSLLSQMIKTKPQPLEKVKTKGKRGSKKPLFQKPSES